MNEITLDYQNIGSFKGEIAGRYASHPELRKVIDGLFRAAQRSSNRAFVLNGTSLVAAQSSRDAALAYMQDGFVLVTVEFPVIEPATLSEAKRTWGYFPFRSCWIAVKPNEQPQIICKPTAHYANRKAREGWFVVQLQRA